MKGCILLFHHQSIPKLWLQETLHVFVVCLTIDQSWTQELGTKVSWTRNAFQCWEFVWRRRDDRNSGLLLIFASLHFFDLNITIIPGLTTFFHKCSFTGRLLFHNNFYCLGVVIKLQEWPGPANILFLIY